MSDLIDNAAQTLIDIDLALRYHGLPICADNLARTFEDLRARITDLEAQLDALRNPPYRIAIEAPEGGFSDCGYQYTIYPQRAAVKVNDGFETEAEARAEAQQFIDKLTAPFAPKA